MYSKEALLARRARLSKGKQALLEKRLRGEAQETAQPRAHIPKRSPAGAPPLSYSQQRLWLVHQLDPDQPTYNEPKVTRFKGELDAKALERSFVEIVRRHEILRSTFVMQNDEPVQIVAPSADLQFEIVDLRSLSEAEKQAKVKTLMAAEIKRPFHLDTDIPWRLLPLRLADDEHMIILIMHHIVCDDWSSGVFNQELITLYHAFSSGLPSPLPELPLQYADFAAWQRDSLQGDTLKRLLTYWQTQLAHLPTLQLPTDRPRPAMETTEGATQMIPLPATLTPMIKRFSQEAGVTTFMTLLAVFKVLLYRYSRQTDIVVGSLIANRNRKELENLIGFFINNLVMRTDLSGNPTFRQLVARVSEVTMAAYAHQDLPFEYLLEHIPYERDFSRTPLFQVMFIWQNAPKRELTLPGLTITPIPPMETGTTQFDITLFMEETDEGTIMAGWEYNTTLFNHATIQRMATHYETLLTTALSYPDTPIATLPLMTATEISQQQAWNNKHLPLPAIQNVVHLFEAQVANTPKAPAVEFEGQQLSYQALNGRANQLAHFLRQQGVGADILVAIYMTRSLDLAVAILAVLKAGGAYLPLDPNYPQERLTHVLEDSQAPLLLTQPTLLTHLPTSPTTTIITPDWAMLNNESHANLNTFIDPDNLAYVIYTSGSTGKPKGVQIPHYALVNHNTAVIVDFALKPTDRILQFVSISFDVAVEEMFPAWLSGATVVFRSEQALDTLTKFLQFVTHHHITVLNIPTPYWNEWVADLAYSQAPLPASLRLLIIGSEKALPEKFMQWHQLVGDQISWRNAYGPTETTITATLYDASHDQTDEVIHSVSIGTPIANTQTYILDTHDQQLPVGLPGELCIGGLGLARGYLNTPRLTAVKFTPDPFTTKAGSRLYRTGDLARYRPDGHIEFLGRIDTQVKIRGFRIELGEVETRLLEHPAIQDVIVTVHEETAENRYLVAYLVTNNTIIISDLHPYLQTKLPHYMIPAVFMVLDEMPLTVHGKINRRALPSPIRDASTHTAPHMPPRDTLEKQLVAMWQEVLEVNSIGIQDNFFDLNGQSLLATRLMTRIHRRFGCQLPLVTLFENPTIAQLAPIVRQHIADTAQDEQILPRAGSSPAPLSFAQQRLWVVHQLDPNEATYNEPDVVRLSGKLNSAALEQSFRDIVQRHDVLRTIFAIDTYEPVQIILPNIDWTFKIIDLTHLPPAERETTLTQLVTDEVKRPFDLTSQPAWRVVPIRLATGEHAIILTMHHIVCDGWSVAIFVQELAELYQAYVTNQPAPLADLPLQYADFATWQRRTLRSEKLAQLLHYWQTQLANPTTLHLPTDHPRPPIQTNNGATQMIPLPPALVTAVKRFSRQNGVTLFMTLLAGFKTLLHRYSGQTDIIVGSVTANRTHKEIEGLIGFFIKNLVLRSDLSGNPTFQETVNQIRQVALDAYAHQDMPFEQLIESIAYERDFSRTPLFQVMFILQNTPKSKLTLPDLTITRVPTHTDTAKFDLTLFMEEAEDGIEGKWEYNTDLFNHDTITRMAGHLETLLTAAIAQPHTPIATLPLLTLSEQAQQQRWHQTTNPTVPLHKSVPQLFETQVAQIPNSLAVVCNDETCTYQELNTQVNRLAHHLIAQHVDSGVVVAVLNERDIDLLISMMAILKAGGAFLLLDPHQPATRLGQVLDQSVAKVVLASPSFMPLLAQATTHCQQQPTILNLQALLQQDAPSHNPPPRYMPDDLAYLMFTSGSTGLPKGVMVQHKGMINHIYGKINDLQMSAADRLAQTSPPTFDIIVWQMFAPLILGNATYIFQDEIVRNPARFVEQLAAHKITLMQIVPSLLYIFMEEIERRGSDDIDLSNLRWQVPTGETLPPELCRKWLHHFPEIPLLNTYGPTECSDDVAHYPVYEPPNKDMVTVSVGKPIGNMQIYILDPYLNPVPIGVPGTIWMGGVGVGRGYIHNPRQTAASFCPDPFSQQTGARFYNTGDLGRFLADGNIEFLGRVDHQVKVRGFRIELGEIELRLLEHPAIREAAVTAHQATPNDTYLTAYVVTEEAHSFTIDNVRQTLQESLPAYMIPTTFMTLDEMPLTQNGKINRRELPPPQRLEQTHKPSYMPARDDVEQQMIQLWESVLGIRPIGVQDNFFDLNGHSLLAIRLMIHIQKQFNHNISLMTLFENPTVAQLAHIVRQRLEPTPWSPLLQLQTEGTDPPFFCVNATGFASFGFHDLAQALGTKQPFYALQPPGLDGRSPILNTIPALAAHYIEAIYTIQPQGPYHIGGHSFGGLVAYEMAQQLHAANQSVATLTLIDTVAPVDNLNPSPQHDQTTLLLEATAVLESLFDQSLGITAAALAQQTADQQRAYFQTKLIQANLLPANTNTNFITNIIAVEKAIQEAIWHYTTHVRPSQHPLILFRAQEPRPANTPQSIQDLAQDAQLGWHKLVPPAMITTHTILGDHFTMLLRPHVTLLADRLKTYLKKVN